MNHNNLAAAILQCASLGSVLEQHDGEYLIKGEHFTNEEAIKLADWLRCESSMNAWRSIYLPSDL
jgi:hypothetical protein